MSKLKQIEIISIRMMDGAGNLKAFVDIRVADAIVITQCAVMQGKQGLIAHMPRQLSRDGRWRDVVVIADPALQTTYEQAILKAYEDVLESQHV